MSHVIMIGCDLHDRSMLICYAVGTGKPKQKSFTNDVIGRSAMLEFLSDLQREHNANRIVFAYEASGQGFGLHDLLVDHDVDCQVLSPTLLPKTPRSKKQKTDARDARMLLDQVRAHVLAGNSLPTVWVPPQRLRDDRELVRCRLDLADQVTRIKHQIMSMLKRRGICKPAWYCGSSWSRRWIAWLRQVADKLDDVVKPVFDSLIQQFELLKAEKGRLEKEIRALARTSRYAAAFKELQKIDGVGLLTAMTFLTEMGDLTRFENRRQIGAYMGLCPSSFESGENDDRKGHITRQGPSRLRRVLCQAAWASLRSDSQESAVYYRIKGGKQGRSKKAIVALMRRLGIKMWHRALAAGVSEELHGRGGPNQAPLAGTALPRGVSVSTSHGPQQPGG